MDKNKKIIFLLISIILLLIALCIYNFANRKTKSFQISDNRKNLYNSENVKVKGEVVDVEYRYAGMCSQTIPIYSIAKIQIEKQNTLKSDSIIYLIIPGSKIISNHIHIDVITREMFSNNSKYSDCISNPETKYYELHESEIEKF